MSNYVNSLIIETPDVSENGDYIVYYDYFTPGNYWCCGSMKVS